MKPMVYRSSGGDDIVDYGYAQTLQFFRSIDAYSPLDIGAPGFVVLARLGGVAVQGCEIVAYRYTGCLGNSTGYLLALVIAPAHTFDPMHGYR